MPRFVFLPALAVLCIVGQASCQFTMETPTNVAQCESMDIAWTIGPESPPPETPYTLIINPTLNDSGVVFHGVTGTSFAYSPVAFPSGTELFVMIAGAQGVSIAESNSFEVGSSSDSSCLAATLSSSPSGSPSVFTVTVTQTQTAAPQTTSGSPPVHHLNVGAVAGGVVGGVVVVVLIGLVGWRCVRGARKTGDNRGAQTAASAGPAMAEAGALGVQDTHAPDEADLRPWEEPPQQTVTTTPHAETVLAWTPPQRPAPGPSSSAATAAPSSSAGSARQPGLEKRAEVLRSQSASSVTSAPPPPSYDHD